MGRGALTQKNAVRQPGSCMEVARRYTVSMPCSTACREIGHRHCTDHVAPTCIMCRLFTLLHRAGWSSGAAMPGLAPRPVHTPARMRACLVGVVLESQFLVSTFHLRVAGGPAQAQDLVGVLGKGKAYRQRCQRDQDEEGCHTCREACSSHHPRQCPCGPVNPTTVRCTRGDHRCRIVQHWGTFMADGNVFSLPVQLQVPMFKCL
jgi:hypothetical protein